MLFFKVRISFHLKINAFFNAYLKINKYLRSVAFVALKSIFCHQWKQITSFNSFLEKTIRNLFA